MAGLVVGIVTEAVAFRRITITGALFVAHTASYLEVVLLQPAGH